MDEMLTPAEADRILRTVPATGRRMAINGRRPTLRTASGMGLFRREDGEQVARERAQVRAGENGAGVSFSRQENEQ